MELFKLLGKIVVDNSNADKAIDDTTDKAEKSKGKFATALGKMGTTAVKVGKFVATGMAAGATAIGAITKKAVDAYADYEQLVGGVETLFGKSADIVQKYAANAYKTAGMSANEYMETVTGFSASLLQSLDNDTEKAAKKANVAITDMSDNANKMGTDISSIQNAYQGFAKQNYTMLDNLKLGYGGTKEEMQRLLSDAEKLSGQKFDLSSYADIVDAIHIVQTEMGITGTTAKEAATTIQGSMSSLKASWQNLLVGMADESQDFDELLSNVIDNGITVINNILPRVKIVFNSIPKLINGLVPQIPKLIKDILPGLIEGATSLMQGLVAALPEIINILIDVLPLILEAIMQISMELVAALPAVIDALIAFLTDQSTITTLLQAAVTLFMAIVAAVPEIANQILAAAPDIIGGLIVGLIQSIPQLLAGLKEVLVQFLNLFLTFFGIHSPSKLMQEKARFILEGIVNGIKELPQKVAQIFLQMRDKAVAKFQELKDKAILKIEELKTKAKTKFDEIRDKIITPITNAKEKIIDTFSSIKENMSAKIENIKSSVTDKFNSIKDKIISPIENARDKIKSIVDKIKGFFSGMTLSFPKIKLPHFKITPSGWKVGDLLQGSIPKLGIDWYDKAMEDGMILNNPTIFGINSKGQPMGGGESGSETVVGTNTLMSMIQMAVNNANAGNSKLLELILAELRLMNSSFADKLSAELQKIGIKWDEREIARLIRKYA